MAGTKVPDLTLKDPVVAQDIIYITDAVNDFKTTLAKVLAYIQTNLTNNISVNIIPKSDGITLVPSRITEDESILELGNDAGAGNKIRINNASGIISLGITDGTLFEIDTNNFKITSTNPIRVNNTVVLQDTNGDRLLTTQQEGVADASILLSSVVTQFNTLLARLRTHGLIKT